MARTAPAATVVDDDDLHVRNLHPTARGPNTDITREKTVIKEREVVTNGIGGRHRQHESEDIIERDYATGPDHGTGVAIADAGPIDAAGIPLPASQASLTGGRINPRTGKPLSLPKPLSLSPHNMSPINPMSNHAGGQLIREEHEEVSNK